MVKSTEINKFNLPYKQSERQKPHDFLIRCRKCFLQNPTPLHDQSSTEIRNTRSIPKHKGDYSKSIAKTYLNRHKQSNFC